MDWVDDAVRGAAPRALGADLATAEQAEALARTVAARSRQPARVSRFRRFLTGSALGIGILGLGVTAATAGPAVFEWVGWTPDVVAQRSFTFDDRSDVGLCEVFVRVVPDYRDPSIEKVERRTEEARQFLAEHDWDPVIESITVNEIEGSVRRRESSTRGDHDRQHDATACDDFGRGEQADGQPHHRGVRTGRPHATGRLD